MILFISLPILICEGSPRIFAGYTLIDLTAWDCIGLEYKGALGLYSLFIIIILSNLYKIFFKYIPAPALELDIVNLGAQNLSHSAGVGGTKRGKFWEMGEKLKLSI